jgi:hypothetical protein
MKSNFKLILGIGALVLLAGTGYYYFVVRPLKTQDEKKNNRKIVFN